MEQLIFLDQKFLKIFGIKGLHDFKTKICCRQYQQSQTQFLLDINCSMIEIKKLFKTSGLSLARKNYKIDSVSLAFSLLKKLLQQTKVPFDIIRSSSDNYLRLSEPNFLLFKYINKMDDITQDVDEITHTNKTYMCPACHTVINLNKAYELQTIDSIYKKDESLETFSHLPDYLSDFQIKEVYTTESVGEKTRLSHLQQTMTIMSADPDFQLKTVYLVNEKMKGQNLGYCFRIVDDQIQCEFKIPQNSDLLYGIKWTQIDQNGFIKSCETDQVKLRISNFWVPDQLKNDEQFHIIPIINCCYQQLIIIFEVSFDDLKKNPKLLQNKMMIELKHGYLPTIPRKTIFQCLNYTLDHPDSKIHQGMYQSNQSLLDDDPFVDDTYKLAKYGFHHPDELEVVFEIPKMYELVNHFSLVVKNIRGESDSFKITRVAIDIGPCSILVTNNPKKILLPNDIPNKLICFDRCSIHINLSSRLMSDQYIELSFHYRDEKYKFVLADKWPYLDKYLISCGTITEVGQEILTDMKLPTYQELEEKRDQLNFQELN